jgi:hypothetical protein
MNNNFNLKQYLSENRLLGEIEVKMGGFNDIVSFLNLHYDEAFEIIVKPSIYSQIEDEIGGVTPEEFGLNPTFHKGWFLSETPGFENCAEFFIDSGYMATGFMTQFEPFTDEQALDVSDETFNNINNNPDIVAGKKIYVFEYSF